MSSLKRTESIRIEVKWQAPGILLVTTEIARTTPRAGRESLALFESLRMPDFPYESSAGYLAKRIRNQVLGSTSDPELLL